MKNQPQHDYSHQVKPVSSPLVRVLLIISGGLLFLLGVLGIFLPVLPTTPFLLASAFCFARSSARFYNLLLNNRVFGSYIRMWREHKSLPLKVKIFAISLICLTVGPTVMFIIPLWPVKILLIVIALSVIIYIARIKTRKVI